MVYTMFLIIETGYLSKSEPKKKKCKLFPITGWNHSTQCGADTLKREKMLTHYGQSNARHFLKSDITALSSNVMTPTY